MHCLVMELVKIPGGLTSVLLLFTVNLADNCLWKFACSARRVSTELLLVFSTVTFLRLELLIFSVIFLCRMQVMGRNPSLLQKRRMKRISK